MTGAAAAAGPAGADQGRFGLEHALAWLAEGDEATPQRSPWQGPPMPFSTVTMSSLPAGYPPMEPGGLFVAIRGERRDGHDFAADALANGARAALLGFIPERLRSGVDAGEVRVADCRAAGRGAAGSTPAPVAVDTSGAVGRPWLLLVDDPLKTLQRCAAWWRRQHDVQVLAVAGSVGKTTTKELLANVVERRYRTLRTPGNFNNELGLPFTLLRLTAAHQRAVLEIGISHPGEMAEFAAIAQPDVAVMTRIAPEHMEFLKDVDTVEYEEGVLIERLRPDGVAALNADDERVARMAARTTARVVRFGESAAAELRARDVQSRGLDGLELTLERGGETRKVRLPLVGRHFVAAALGAAAAAFEAGCQWEDVLGGLGQLPETRRLAPRRLAGGVTVLDDTYNASPDSCRAALDVLAAVPGRRVAVLGDMFELGEYAVEGHRQVGQHVPGRADVLVSVGELGQEIARAAREAGVPPGAIHACASNDTAVDALREILAPGDTVLVKGSHGMRMEQIVHALPFLAEAVRR